jgi:vacuolar-type H+-ATPase subunit H
MSSAIEQTVKALVEFEARLESAKAELLESGRRATKEAVEWAEAAKAAAVSRAQEIAARNMARAREEAESDARRIRDRGESDLKAFEVSISKNRARASELVASRLLGESA